MSKPMFLLTLNEREIMEIMWKEGKALSRSEIIELSPERSWKEGSIHILLNKMLGKGALEVVGFVKTGKNYGRTFGPTVTRDEYQIFQFKQSVEYQESKSKAITNLMTALVQEEELDEETLDRLEKILKRRKEGKK